MPRVTVDVSFLAKKYEIIKIDFGLLFWKFIFLDSTSKEMRLAAMRSMCFRSDHTNVSINCFARISIFFSTYIVLIYCIFVNWIMKLEHVTSRHSRFQMTRPMIWPKKIMLLTFPPNSPTLFLWWGNSMFFDRSYCFWNI